MQAAVRRPMQATASRSTYTRAVRIAARGRSSQRVRLGPRRA